MKSKIETAYQSCIERLAPTKAELERGLELHKDSLVFDLYGLEPRVPLNPSFFKETLERGLSPDEIYRMKDDMAILGCVDSNSCINEEYKKAWESSGVTCLGQPIGRNKFPFKGLCRYLLKTELMRDFLCRAVFPEDIEKAKQAGRHCLYFGSNMPVLEQRWDSIEEEFGDMLSFFQAGLRMCHLTYNRRNAIGDGCAEASDAGLSDFGRYAVKKMNQIGVIVDVAHCGHRTSLEAALTSEKPMTASHTTAFGVHPHIRAKKDETIKAIADKGGVVGINCVPCFLGGSEDINALLDHIDYVVDLVGIDHVAIGTDRSYDAEGFDENRRACFVEGFPKGRKSWCNFWPPGSLECNSNNGKNDLTLEWTNWPLFTVGLVKRKYSDDDIRKIIGLNALRLAKSAMPGARAYEAYYK